MPNSSNPPALPGTLSRPDAQRIIDALNLRLHEAEVKVVALEKESATGEGLKIIRGNINSTTPAIVKGAGFTITKTAAGRITVNFTAPFSDVPSVVGMPHNGSNLAVIGEKEPTAAAAFLVGINTGFSATDGTFAFIAIGPR